MKKSKRNYPTLREAFGGSKGEEQYDLYDAQRNLDRGNWEGPGAFGPSAKDVDFSGINKHNKVEEPGTKKEAVVDRGGGPFVPHDDPAVGELERSEDWKNPKLPATGWGRVGQDVMDRRYAKLDKERAEKASPKKEACGAKMHNEHCGCGGGETDDMNAFTLGRVGAPGGPDLGNGPKDMDDVEILFDKEAPVSSLRTEGKTKKNHDKDDDDDDKLATHQGLDMSRWEQRVHIGSEDDDDEKKGAWRNKTWEGFGRGDYKMKKEARGLPKVSGGGPEYEDDPHMEGDDIYDIDPKDLEPEVDDVDRPEDEEYIQSLIKQREYDDGANRAQDFGRFIDPDELPW